MHDSGESVDERLKSPIKFSFFIFKAVYLIKGNSIFECPSCTAMKNLNQICTNFFVQYTLTYERKYASGTRRHTESGKTYKHRSIIFTLVIDLKTKR